MEINMRDHDGVSVLDIIGEVDIYSGEDLRQCLDEAVTEGSPVLLNISKTDYIDSYGLSLLISFKKKLGKAGRKFGLCCPQSYVRRILNLTKLFDFLTVYENEEQAVSAYKASKGEVFCEENPKISIQADERRV